MNYKLKSLITGEYVKLGKVDQIIVEGPKAEYAYLRYANGQLHQVKCLGFSKNDCLEARKVALSAVAS